MFKEYFNCWKHIFNYKGRSNRKEFWSYVLISALLLFVIDWINYKIGEIMFVIFCLPLLAVSIRRLHDIGDNAHILLRMLIVLFIMIVCVECNANDIVIGFFAVALSIMTLRFLIMTLIKGDDDENKYGVISLERELNESEKIDVKKAEYLTQSNQNKVKNKKEKAEVVDIIPVHQNIINEVLCRDCKKSRKSVEGELICGLSFQKEDVFECDDFVKK